MAANLPENTIKDDPAAFVLFSHEVTISRLLMVLMSISAVYLAIRDRTTVVDVQSGF
ncbi:uncharacterized protein BO80DRAFT_427519 [Aspergillus ibericus CBS 121593]|uniref:Uncharacterized protein n=1 Tax=Aspergillus ibericus CBS 121593 TaxID=1448316 RepID=A0A395GVX4_9EURO|nr:hypothetical protein BO80DRAFT_427519 [Aspergillus ibericus CBS 121593]RAK98223.1 hypothetical protein BO80DRAFT_427519 [Aspergillus ibericus CBS 121593]